MDEKKLKTSVIDRLVAEQNEVIKQYENGDGLLQKIADGRVKIKSPLKFPNMKAFDK